MVSEDYYEIWVLPQKLQSGDIILQPFWSNWCSAEGDCNTSCCDVPCILFSTVSGHACHSSSVWVLSCDPAVRAMRLNTGRLQPEIKTLSVSNKTMRYSCWSVEKLLLCQWAWLQGIETDTFNYIFPLIWSVSVPVIAQFVNDRRPMFCHSVRAPLK